MLTQGPQCQWGVLLWHQHLLGSAPHGEQAHLAAALAQEHSAGTGVRFGLALCWTAPLCLCGCQRLSALRLNALLAPQQKGQQGSHSKSLTLPWPLKGKTGICSKKCYHRPVPKHTKEQQDGSESSAHLKHTQRKNAQFFDWIMLCSNPGNPNKSSWERLRRHCRELCKFSEQLKWWQGSQQHQLELQGAQTQPNNHPNMGESPGQRREQTKQLQNQSKALSLWRPLHHSITHAHLRVVSRMLQQIGAECSKISGSAWRTCWISNEPVLQQGVRGVWDCQSQEDHGFFGLTSSVPQATTLCYQYNNTHLAKQLQNQSPSLSEDNQRLQAVCWIQQLPLADLVR